MASCDARKSNKLAQRCRTLEFFSGNVCLGCPNENVSARSNQMSLRTHLVVFHP